MAKRSGRPQASSPEALPDLLRDPLRGSDLPAPYQDPWGLLRRDLRAVLASLRLKLQELWRRNREGDLSVPGIWPAGLAPLFWPLALMVLLALPLALGRLWSSQAVAAPPAPVSERLVTTPLPDAQLLEPLAAAAGPARRPAATEAPEAVDEPPAAFAQAAPAKVPEIALDPLLQLLAEDDPEHLIASARPLPAEGLLQLSVTPEFTHRPPLDRADWAVRWQQWAAELGFDRLELLDVQRRLLGRKALVGSGMILLDVDCDS